MAGDRAYIIWKGHGSDEAIYCARRDPGRPIGDSGTVGYYTTSRGLAAIVSPADHSIVAAWRGAGDDSRISTASAIFDGSSWGAQYNPKGAPRTEDRPALGVLGDRVFLAWRGTVPDEHIWYSEFGGDGWSPQRLAGNGLASSARGPALAERHGRLYLAWRGSGTNENLYWSSFDGDSWADPVPYAGGSTHGPALAATASGDLVMTWKGSSGDDRLWWASLSADGWSPQRAAYGRSSHGPAVGLVGNRVVMLWKGTGADEHLWWSWGGFDSQQAVRADYTASDTPAIVGIAFAEL